MRPSRSRSEIIALTAVPAVMLLAGIALPQMPGTGAADRQVSPPIDPDVTEALSGLHLERLPPPLPVFFGPADRAEAVTAGRARERQILLQEARAFWRNLLDAVLPDGGVVWVDSAVWTVLRNDLWYGFPGAAVNTSGDGRLALLAAGRSTTFGEHAATAFQVAPLGFRGRLVAAGLGTAEGAAGYAEAWTWVVCAERLTDELRIGTARWWQRRLVGAAAAWLFLEAPRGRELVPGEDRALEEWGRFWTGYLAPAAVGLAAADAAPPAQDPRARLEMDARLLLFARQMLTRYGLESFERLRRAWPVDAPYAGPAGALDALWTTMPELRAPGEVLLRPAGPVPPPAVQSGAIPPVVEPPPPGERSPD
jgi:hypothetical protein